MSEQIEMVAILSPKPGAVDQVIEALTPFNKYVEENEPGVLKYEFYRQVNVDSGKEDLVYLELYKDKESFEIHATSSPFKAMREKAAKEQLLVAPIEVKVLKRVGGFSLRDAK
ncbi:MAG: hypothetical protein ALECFALPRED_000984 [Alectoria fallacina]|uniref:ABM domain-containing protein n=1 Tax=Alectoria fallacina TaxID=1903189 RepID=A0A8H3F8S6_9LECA|nr:MAG: hypothetical protein ALECFALPRED_000984 [Alectoria fallacina]